MDIISKSKTIPLNGKTLKVTLERGVWDEEVHLDGTPTGTYRTYLVERTKIALYDDRKELVSGDALAPLPKQHRQLSAAVQQGCVGMVGREWFVKPATADAIRKALAELEEDNPKTARQIQLEAEAEERQRIGEENLRRMEAEQRERERHPGWCKRCQDYTYGDCGHRH